MCHFKLSVLVIFCLCISQFLEKCTIIMMWLCLSYLFRYLFMVMRSFCDTFSVSNRATRTRLVLVWLRSLDTYENQKSVKLNCIYINTQNLWFTDSYLNIISSKTILSSRFWHRRCACFTFDLEWLYFSWENRELYTCPNNLIILTHLNSNLRSRKVIW